MLVSEETRSYITILGVKSSTVLLFRGRHQPLECFLLQIYCISLNLKTFKYRSRIFVVPSHGYYCPCRCPGISRWYAMSGYFDDWKVRHVFMMTSSNGNIFRVTGLCEGNSPVTGEFPSQRPVMRSFGVFFDLRLNERLSKRSRRWWFQKPSCSLWRHYNVSPAYLAISDSVSHLWTKWRHLK